MNFAELLDRSASLPYAMPTQANRLAHFADRREEVEAHALGVRPILHAQVWELIREFLVLKSTGVDARTRPLYASMDPAAFVTRLLTRRPLAFLTSSDSYLLRGGEQGEGGFEAIGGPHERDPLRLEALLSYDEMAISALLGVSVPTHFINAGSRTNGARPGAPGSFVPRGVYVGLVGARFERAEQMEWRHLLVTPTQNTAAKGYGPDAEAGAPATELSRIWARFYGRAYLPTHAEAAADRSGRYVEIRGLGLFDTELYRRRLRASIAPFLRDADLRAAAAGKGAYVHVVGLGLGVWKVDACQQRLMIEVYAELLRELELPAIADLDFSWFSGAEACGGVREGERFETESNAVRLHFSRRDPAAPLTGADADKLLVAMYAWDANAFPGNEYWEGALSASGDPAAACCSTIPELQNPDVNPRVAGEHAWVFGPGAAPGLAPSS